MQILSVRLQNIKSHRERELSFSPGINVLSGPNGIGKSTVFEAIGYALFGVDARDFVANAERFLSIGAKRGEVAVTFRGEDGETWRVTRTVGGASRWLLARRQGEEFEVEEHAGAAETEKRLAELLGLDNGRPLAEQFKLVVGPFQNDFLGPFVLRQPARRRGAFDEILGIDSWRRTFEGSRALEKGAQEKIRLLETEIAARREQTVLLPEKEQERVALESTLAEKEKELAATRTALALALQALQRFEAQKSALDAASGLLKQTETSLASGREHIASQGALVEEAEAAAAVVATTAAAKECYDRAEARQLELRQREQQRRQAEQALHAAEKRAQAAGERLAHEEAEIERTDNQIAAEEQQLDKSRQALAPEPALQTAAARRPELQATIEKLKAEQARLQGRQGGLREGQEKLAAGVCPFFQEPCLNLAEAPERDVFSDRLAALAATLESQERALAGLLGELATAEAAEGELRTRAIRAEALAQQLAGLAERRRSNRQRAAGLEGLLRQKEQVATQLATQQEALQRFAGLEEELAAVEMELQASRAERDRYLAHARTAGELEGRKVRLGQYRQRLIELEAERTAQARQVTELQGAYDPAGHEAARGERDRLGHAAGGLEEGIKGLRANLDRLGREIDALRRVAEEVARKEKERAGFAKKEQLVRFLRNQVFNKVSARLSERFREEISRRAERIYRTIAETDEELYWGENYQIVLRDMARRRAARAQRRAALRRADDERRGRPAPGPAADHRRPGRLFRRADQQPRRRPPGEPRPGLPGHRRRPRGGDRALVRPALPDQPRCRLHRNHRPTHRTGGINGSETFTTAPRAIILTTGDREIPTGHQNSRPTLSVLSARRRSMRSRRFFTPRPGRPGPAPRPLRLRLQPDAEKRGGGHRGLGQRAGDLPAPRRPDPQPGGRR